MQRNKTALNVSPKSSVSIDQKIRSALIGGILLSSLLAVMLINQDLKQFRIGDPHLIVSASPKVASPGEQVTYTFSLTGLPRKSEGYIDFENQLADGSGFEFIPGSLNIKMGNIGKADVSDYSNTSSLSIKQIPGSSSSIVFTVDAVVPNNPMLIGQSINHKSFFKFGGKKYHSENTSEESSILIRR